MEQNAFLLDDQAQELFRQIEGVDFGRDETSLGKALSEEERKLNACRGQLGELVHLLGKCLKSVDLLKDADTGKTFLGEFLSILRKLGRTSGHDGKILIRYRGLKTGTEATEKVDYVVLFGNMVFDMATAVSMVKNLEEFSTDFQARLTAGFEVFSEQGINSLYVKIPEDSPAAAKAMWVALNTLSRRSQAISTGSSAMVDSNSSEASLTLVHDEQDQPDFNLTMLAKVNRVKPETMKALVQKVDSWMHGPNYDGSEEPYSSVYNAILGNRKLRQKLVPPPIEVNNIKWLMIDDEYEVVSKQKTEVARLVVGKYGNSPQDTARIMGSVYGDDFERVDSQNLGERLKLASNLLTSIEETAAAEPVMEEVLDNVEKRLDQVSDETYDGLKVDGDVIKAKHGEEETTIGRIHARLKGIFGFFKARSAVKKKLQNLAERGISFDEHDYKVIAKDFAISTDEARELVETFQGCFDDDGLFLRDAFSRNVSQFAKYKKKIFEFLWHYLKQMSRREDRMALFNSLHMLIPHLKQPRNILKVLISDFSKDPESVAVSDRSVLVLITLLLTNYNKEPGKDIEITPEEVIGISEGQDTKLIAGVSKLIDGNQETFFKKFRTIHRKLNEFLVRPPSEGEPISLRDIFLLEREAYIFLSVVGGNTARALIRSAARAFGEPKGGIYHFRESERFLPSLLQLLKIVSRGLGRVGETKDSSLLEEIKEREQEFLEIARATGHQEHVKRAVEQAEFSLKNIARVKDESKKVTSPVNDSSAEIMQ